MLKILAGSSSTSFGQQVAAALAGQQSVEEALENSQKFAAREMSKAGYN